MASRTKPPARPVNADNATGTRDSAPRPFDFGEAIPLPEVIEKDSDSVWAMWTDATKDPSGRDTDTQPATLLMGLPDFPKDPDTP